MHERDSTTLSTLEAQQRLFPLPQGGAMRPVDPPETGGTPRFQAAERNQVEFRACCWNELLPPDHQARLVWDYVTQLDLSPLYGKIKAVEHRPGHPPIDPRILTALWLYAVLRGIG